MKGKIGLKSDLKSTGKKIAYVCAAVLCAAATACAGCSKVNDGNGMQSPSTTGSPGTSESMYGENLTGDAASATDNANVTYCYLNLNDGTQTGTTYRLSYDGTYFATTGETTDADRMRLSVTGISSAATVLVRISPPASSGDADVRDYYMLAEKDNATDSDIKTVDVDGGKVSYYITSSNLDQDSYVYDVYYACRADDKAVLCGIIGLTDIGNTAMPNDNGAYAENLFNEETARQLFGALIRDVKPWTEDMGGVTASPSPSTSLTPTLSPAATATQTKS